MWQELRSTNCFQGGFVDFVLPLLDHESPPYVFFSLSLSFVIDSRPIIGVNFPIVPGGQHRSRYPLFRTNSFAACHYWMDTPFSPFLGVCDCVSKASDHKWFSGTSLTHFVHSFASIISVCLSLVESIICDWLTAYHRRQLRHCPSFFGVLSYENSRKPGTAVHLASTSRFH